GDPPAAGQGDAGIRRDVPRVVVRGDRHLHAAVARVRRTGQRQIRVLPARFDVGLPHGVGKTAARPARRTYQTLHPCGLDAKVDRIMKKNKYEDKIKALAVELVELQRWLLHSGKRVVILFEGRDAAGKGGVIKAIGEHLDTRHYRIVALPKPSERE